MPEVRLAGEHHGDAKLVGGVDGILVLHRTAGLGNGSHAGFGLMGSRD